MSTEKTRPRNSTIKPPSTLSVSCMKIQEGMASLPTPMVYQITQALYDKSCVVR